MNKRIVLLAALLLSACVGGVGNSPSGATYDFGLPAAPLRAGSGWQGLALDVRAPGWLDSTHVDYRLAYADPLTRRQYAGARWAGTPATLIAQRLRQQLGAVSPAANAATACALRIELQEFSQVFDSPGASRGVLSASVSLVDAKRRMLAERAVTVDKPAASADASGGVRALVAATTELGQVLSDWFVVLEKDGRLASCRSS